MSEELQGTFGPYLTVKGAKAAIGWYEKVLGAKTQFTMDEEDGDRLMHATLTINGHVLMLSDEFSEFENHTVAPTKSHPSPVAISVGVAIVDEVDRIYHLAIKEGATRIFEPEDMFWGDRFCQFLDPFFHRWMLVSPLEKEDNKSND